jgi:hypothetical protein
MLGMRGWFLHRELPQEPELQGAIVAALAQEDDVAEGEQQAVPGDQLLEALGDFQPLQQLEQAQQQQGQQQQQAGGAEQQQAGGAEQQQQAQGQQGQQGQQQGQPPGTPRVVAIHRGQGQVADEGFSRPQWVTGRLWVYEDGSAAFVWLSHFQFMVEYQRLDPELLPRET